jgi:hypothetical protein
MHKGSPCGSRLSFERALARVASRCAILVFLSVLARAAGTEYPWVVLTPADDSRSAHMRQWDEGESLNTVSVINLREELFDHRLVWKKAAVRELLSMDAPFCELRFDAVHPFRWSAGEKSILAEYLRRGGFILFLLDAYPYSQDEFWAIGQWPVIDFITKELPGADRDFSPGKAGADLSVFKSPKPVHTPDWIQYELSGNARSCDRTMLSYQGRLCGFVIGEYSNYRLNGKGGWIGLTRDPPMFYLFGEQNIDLIVNLYASSMLR